MKHIIIFIIINIIDKKKLINSKENIIITIENTLWNILLFLL